MNKEQHEKVKKVLNKEQLEAFIKSIKDGTTNPRLSHLCEALEAFMAVFASRNQGQKSEAYEKKLKASYRNLWDSFDAAAESYGIEVDQFIRCMTNQTHFTPEGPKAMNHLQQSLEAIEAIEGPAPACTVKKKSKKKNVRI
jgi:uncharacterized damage-inducible protein DinB